MEYIRTDDIERFDIKYGQLAESPLRGSTTRFIANPIVDDIAADPPKGRARRQRINGRIIIDTTVPDGDDYRYEPPSCLVTGKPGIADLTTERWEHRDPLTREAEAALIQCIKDGYSSRPEKSDPGRDDEGAFRQLLEAFHFKNVLKPARGYIPTKKFRATTKQKPTTVQLYEDLIGTGCLELWRSALRFDGRGRFSTLARRRIVGEISNEANYWRQGGYTSGDTVGRYLRATKLEKIGGELPRRTAGTRIDRWIFSNLGSTPEELLEAQKRSVKRPVFHSLEDAAEALKRANNLQHPDIYSDAGGDDAEDDYSTGKPTTATAPLEEYHDVYDTHKYGRDHLALHCQVSAVVDFWIGELCDPPRIKAKPNPKPIYKPCTVKPTGRVLKPIETPYWMRPRETRPKEFAGKPYDPDRREVAAIRLKNGKIKRLHRQMAAKPDSNADVTWRETYTADWYSWMSSEKERKANEPNKANGGAAANIVVLESRRSSKPRLHVRVRHLPASAGRRSTS